MSHRILNAVALAALTLSAYPQAASAQTIPNYVSTAVDDMHRPQPDKMRDVNRKPAESIAFAGVKPGDKVVDFLAGGGYFTRILSKVVGPQGHVYATDRKSTRLNSSHSQQSRMPSSA